MNAARQQLLKETAGAAQAVREVALANPVEPDTAYPLGEVLDQLGAAHRRLLEAITGYPHELAVDPDTGGIDKAAHLLANLVSAVSRVVVRYHGQREFRLFDRDSFALVLREALVQATHFLAELGPIESDVHRYARYLARDMADPRWRAATVHAAAFAESAWKRAVRPEKTVHELGLAMLAVSLFATHVETGVSFGPQPQLRLRTQDLLAPVAKDPIWVTGQMDLKRSSTAEDRQHQIAERDQRMDQLKSRIETALVVAGVDLHHPGPQHRVLVAQWRYLQEPAPQDHGSDLAINGYALPYTWRAHLAEGAVRAFEYLTSAPLSPAVRPG
ncbi:hypothetical protein NQK81_02150 [Amycolatopsis roodepoortensis]|uniref:hypothetical protein n=1 Tax=Amycolatopsis roodepoortensis TaxID=700274 RepID=UPI00214CE1E4|nr:hypothetical protein [Amycolatopsis roodepoortensis]UUV32276.1 hypothetical protein NQK81_02150 [Amycolatopsis roodepoortensis]